MGDFNTLSPLLLRNHDVRAALNLSLQSLCLIKEVTPQKRFFCIFVADPTQTRGNVKSNYYWVKNSKLLTIYFIVLTSALHFMWMSRFLEVHIIDQVIFGGLITLQQSNRPLMFHLIITDILIPKQGPGWRREAENSALGCWSFVSDKCFKKGTRDPDHSNFVQ